MFGDDKYVLIGACLRSIECARLKDLLEILIAL